MGKIYAPPKELEATVPKLRNFIIDGRFNAGKMDKAEEKWTDELRTWCKTESNSEYVGEVIRQVVADGYASQPIAKYTQGHKTGQIIDIGNAFKSAMSKAIKTAVAKWGVGLYLEKGSVNESDSAGSWGPPSIPTSVPEIKPVEQPKIEQPPVSVPVAEPVNVPSDIPNSPFDIPTTTPKPAAPPEEVPGPAPVFTDDNVVVTQPNTTSSFNPPMGSVSTAGEVEKLTDVQKAAIENIMSVHNKTFAELASAALQRSDNLPSGPEVLDYPDAVKLIQYGNNLNTSS